MVYSFVAAKRPVFDKKRSTRGDVISQMTSPLVDLT
jgi:hypothetical protein